MLFLNLQRKDRRWRITKRTIDYEVGIFSQARRVAAARRVERIELRQSFMDRLLGIATIHLLTTDADAEPGRGLPASREIFDRLKEPANLARQQRVVGVVE